MIQSPPSGLQKSSSAALQRSVCMAVKAKELVIFSAEPLSGYLLCESSLVGLMKRKCHRTTKPTSYSPKGVLAILVLIKNAKTQHRVHAQIAIRLTYFPSMTWRGRQH